MQPSADEDHLHQSSKQTHEPELEYTIDQKQLESYPKPSSLREKDDFGYSQQLNYPEIPLYERRAPTNKRGQ